MKNKKNTRMCAFCRERRDKDALIRVVHSAGEEKAYIDLSGKAQGRGAYLCKSDACIAGAKKTRMLARNLKCAVPGEMFDEMKRLMKEK